MLEKVSFSVRALSWNPNMLLAWEGWSAIFNLKILEKCVDPQEDTNNMSYVCTVFRVILFPFLSFLFLASRDFLASLSYY